MRATAAADASTSLNLFTRIHPASSTFAPKIGAAAVFHDDEIGASDQVGLDGRGSARAGTDTAARAQVGKCVELLAQKKSGPDSGLGVPPSPRPVVMLNLGRGRQAVLHDIQYMQSLVHYFEPDMGRQAALASRKQQSPLYEFAPN
ncbi:hypothetical protein MY10362_005203 [Beauveria mimosiformis]